MLKTIFLIVISFFAVIGILECFLNALECLSVAKYDSITKLELRAELNGHIEDVTFLLNTILLQAERIRYKSSDATVVIVDGGLDDVTYSRVFQFCCANSNICVEKKN